VLLYYGFVRIPAQEAYLNERNLRLLATLSEPLKAKVDSFDAALDHVHSFSIDRLETLDGVCASLLLTSRSNGT
jgi:hypothetical protein